MILADVNLMIKHCRSAAAAKSSTMSFSGKGCNRTCKVLKRTKQKAGMTSSATITKDVDNHTNDR
eukprot:6054089-Amphidinium_carterae.1